MIFLYDNFKKDRLNQYTQEGLAQATGMKLEIIKNIENGRKKISPEHEDFKHMCDVLNLNPYDYFIKDTKVITFLSNKGGSTKTSSCANLAFAMATHLNKNILLIDTDLQQNLTQHFGVTPTDNENFYEAFIKNESVEMHIRPTIYKNIDIVTGHDKLALIETDILKMDFREYRVKEILQEIKYANIYDYIFIDCNPSLNSLNTSILFATDGLIVPLVPTAFGKAGMDLIVNFYNMISKRADNLHLLGVLVNRFDRRKKTPKDVMYLVSNKFGKEGLLFKTVISEDSSIDKAQLMEKPVKVAFPKSRSAGEFDKLAEELVKRGRKI